MAKYVDYGGLTTAPGPLKCTGTRLSTFFCSADKDRLRELCRQMFDEPSGGEIRVEPLFAAVQVTYGIIDRIRPAPPFDAYGNVTERQTAIWIPVLVHRDGHLPFFAAAIPYIWLEDPLSVATGREMYGYPKNWGLTRFPDEMEDGLAAFVLKAYTIDRYAPDSKPSMKRLLSVTPPATPAARAVAAEDAEVDAEDMHEAFAGLVAELREAGVGPDLPRELRAAEDGSVMGKVFASVFRPGINQLFLRQFRSPRNGSVASQQEIIRCPARIGRFSGLTRLPRHEVEVVPADSHPLRDLDMASGQTVLAFEVRFDFTVEVGEVLWSA